MAKLNELDFVGDIVIPGFTYSILYQNNKIRYNNSKELDAYVLDIMTNHFFKALEYYTDILEFGFEELIENYKSSPELLDVMVPNIFDKIFKDGDFSDKFERFVYQDQ